MAKSFDHRLSCEERLVGIGSLAESRENGGGVLAVLLRSDGRAERVVEVRGALGGRDRIASADVRLVDELLVAALDQREAVPEEGFGLRRGAGRPVVAPYRR